MAFKIRPCWDRSGGHHLSVGHRAQIYGRFGFIYCLPPTALGQGVHILIYPPSLSCLLSIGYPLFKYLNRTGSNDPHFHITLQRLWFAAVPVRTSETISTIGWQSAYFIFPFASKEFCRQCTCPRLHGRQVACSQSWMEENEMAQLLARTGQCQEPAWELLGLILQKLAGLDPWELEADNVKNAQTCQEFL